MRGTTGLESRPGPLTVTVSILYRSPKLGPCSGGPIVRGLCPILRPPIKLGTSIPSTWTHFNRTYIDSCVACSRKFSSMSLLRSSVCRACHRSQQIRWHRGLATASNQSYDNRVRLVEVGPRDGLQNEKKAIPLETKIELIERLARTGVSTIEAGSFVAPKWVPQVVFLLLRCLLSNLTLLR